MLNHIFVHSYADTHIEENNILYEVFVYSDDTAIGLNLRMYRWLEEMCCVSHVIFPKLQQQQITCM